MGARRRKRWGWGFEEAQPSPGELRALAPFVERAVDPAGSMNPGVLLDPR